MKTKDEKLAVLAKIAKRLNEADITWGVGASLLLYFKGITDEFNDIDIMVTAEDVGLLKELLEQLGELQPPNPDGKYKTRHFYEFVIDGVDVDVMEGFVIVKGGKEYDASFTRDSVYETIEVNGQQIPLQSVADWRKFYELMGREAKVRMIEEKYIRDEM